MRSIMTLVLASALLLGVATDCRAEEAESFLEAEVTQGFHYLYGDEDDNLGRVAEYVDLERNEDLQAYLDLSMFGGTPNALYRIMALYEDQSTMEFLTEVHAGQYWRTDTSFQSFQHNLDDDQLTNLVGREWNVERTAPGGKQIYHTDADPDGVYGIEYSRFDNKVEYDMPWLPKSTAYVSYSDQKRQGFKQAMHVAHCSFCHVEATGREVNDQIQTWRAGLQAQVENVAFTYEYKATHYADRGSAASRTLTDAQHPTQGNSGHPLSAVADDRLNYDYSNTGPDGSGPNVTFMEPRKTTRRSHQVGAKVTLPAENTLRGGYTRTDRKNWNTNVESSYDAFVGSWLYRPTKDVRATARGLYYTTKVDDFEVDGRFIEELPIQGQVRNFDWTRISSANRDVLQADANIGWRWREGGFLKAAYRYRTIDRESMTQSQVNYLQNEGGIDERVDSEPFANETVENRVSLLARQRFGRKGNVRAKVTFEMNDDPFYNPTGICEDALTAEESLIDGDPATNPAVNKAIYYFQRLRYGNAGERPTEALRYQLQGAYQIDPRVSVSIFGNYADEMNDDLNVYDFERTRLGVGANLWAAPADQFMVSLGYAFNSVESNAKMCIPLFDG